MFGKLKNLKFTAPRGLKKTAITVPTKDGFCSPLFVYGFDLCLPTEWKVHIRTRNIYKRRYIVTFIVVEANDYWEAMRKALYGLAPGDTIVSIKRA